MLDERGFSLMEALTAATISVIAVLGLAYSFSIGHGLVDRYDVARAAVGVAQAQLESMAVLPRSDAQFAIRFRSSSTPFLYEDCAVGSSDWRVTALDDPDLPGTSDFKRVVVTVRWRQDTRMDSLSLERLWLP